MARVCGPMERCLENREPIGTTPFECGPNGERLESVGHWERGLSLWIIERVGGLRTWNQ